jgi:acetoin utilization deacetylase AcuC-like enzyme
MLENSPMIFLVFRNLPITSGFCFFNNVAVGAKHAIETGRANRVFILDWDIHHGNGIQDLTIDDPNIFYLSIHRASSGSKNKKSWYYPGTGRPNEVGTGNGVGTNLNICWGEGDMGDLEYSAAFSKVVLPILYNFKPDLIMVACGLDAVKGDLIGDCGLTVDMFYRMTRCLLEASPKTPIVMALEGGYHLDQSALCMQNVALALLDEPLDYEERRKYVSWSSASIIPHKHQIQTSETSKMAEYMNENMTAAGKHYRNTTRKAVKSIKRSATALEKRGGTCHCGCHFLCEHSVCLPIKKRKNEKLLAWM